MIELKTIQQQKQTISEIATREGLKEYVTENREFDDYSSKAKKELIAFTNLMLKQFDKPKKKVTKKGNKPTTFLLNR